MVEITLGAENRAIAARADPACDTGGFFLVAYEYIVNHHKLDPDHRRHLRSGAFTGWEVVDNTARLCVLRLGVSRVAVHRLTFGLVPNSSLADDIGMAYIIERNDRYYVVAYDGNDPRTGKERRRWHPAGTSREDAEAIAARLSAERQGARDRMTSALRVEQYLLEVWLPRRKRELRPSTARRYQWYVENYITPAIAHTGSPFFALNISTGCTTTCSPRRSRRRSVVCQDGLRRSRRDAFVVAVRRRPSPRRSQRRSRRATTTDLNAVTTHPRDLDRAATRLVPRSYRAASAVSGDSSCCDDWGAER